MSIKKLLGDASRDATDIARRIKTLLLAPYIGLPTNKTTLLTSSAANSKIMKLMILALNTATSKGIPIFPSHFELNMKNEIGTQMLVNQQGGVVSQTTVQDNIVVRPRQWSVKGFLSSADIESLINIVGGTSSFALAGTREFANRVIMSYIVQYFVWLRNTRVPFYFYTTSGEKVPCLMVDCKIAETPESTYAREISISVQEYIALEATSEFGAQELSNAAPSAGSSFGSSIIMQSLGASLLTVAGVMPYVQQRFLDANTLEKINMGLILPDELISSAIQIDNALDNISNEEDATEEEGEASGASKSESEETTALISKLINNYIEDAETTQADTAENKMKKLVKDLNIVAPAFYHRATYVCENVFGGIEDTEKSEGNKKVLFDNISVDITINTKKLSLTLTKTLKDKESVDTSDWYLVDSFDGSQSYTNAMRHNCWIHFNRGYSFLLLTPVLPFNSNKKWEELTDDAKTSALLSTVMLFQFE